MNPVKKLIKLLKKEWDFLGSYFDSYDEEILIFSDQKYDTINPFHYKNDDEYIHIEIDKEIYDTIILFYKLRTVFTIELKRKPHGKFNKRVRKQMV
jgi:hypothetical protein